MLPKSECFLNLSAICKNYRRSYSPAKSIKSQYSKLNLLGTGYWWSPWVRLENKKQIGPRPLSLLFSKDYFQGQIRSKPSVVGMVCRWLFRSHTAHKSSLLWARRVDNHYSIVCYWKLIECSSSKLPTKRVPTGGARIAHQSIKPLTDGCCKVHAMKCDFSTLEKRANFVSWL